MVKKANKSAGSIDFYLALLEKKNFSHQDVVSFYADLVIKRLILEYFIITEEYNKSSWSLIMAVQVVE